MNFERSIGIGNEINLKWAHNMVKEKKKALHTDKKDKTQQHPIIEKKGNLKNI